jgi:hypothetical protein
MFHIVKNKKPAVYPDHAAPSKVLGSAIGFWLTEFPQRCEPGFFLHASSVDDPYSGRRNRSVPAGRRGEIRCIEAINQDLALRVGKFHRFSHEKRGDENLAKVTVYPKGGIQDAGVEFYEWHWFILLRVTTVVNPIGRWNSQPYVETKEIWDAISRQAPLRGPLLRAHITLARSRSTAGAVDLETQRSPANSSLGLSPDSPRIAIGT